MAKIDKDKAVELVSKKSPKLPYIEITGTRDEVYTVMTMNMDDATFQLFVEEGKRVADDHKYFEIGFLHALEETVLKEIKSKKAKKHGTTRPRKNSSR